MFNHSKKSKGKWKAEYDNEFYKVYDSKKKLAGYFFPDYGDLHSLESETERVNPNENNERDVIAIEELNKSHSNIRGANLLLPMAKLNLLDNQGGMDINYVIESLDANIKRTMTWRRWLEENARQFSIVGAAVYTAREDRNMLSIALGISSQFTLGEKEVGEFLSMLLDKLQVDGLL